MTELGVVRRRVKRAERAAVEALGRYGVATVHEAMGRVGLMKPYMRPIYPGALVSGTAVTVLLHPGDNWMMHVVAEQIQPGDIVVAAITADCTDGYFGDLLATSFMARGAKALILNYSKSRKEAEVTAKAVQAAGAEAVLVQGDVGEDADCRKIAAAAAPYGKLDVLANRLVFALVTTGGLIGSSLIGILAKTGPHILGLNVVSALGFVLSGVLGVWLLWGVVRSGRI